MFGEPFSTEMSGCFVLLCQKHECKVVKKCAEVAQEEIEYNSSNPFKAMVSGKITREWLDGEMVIMELDSRFPLFVVSKLPCHTDKYGWEVGDFVEAIGELQFQTTPQLDFKNGGYIRLSSIEIVKEDNLTNDLICVVNLKDVLSCQEDQKSS